MSIKLICKPEFFDSRLKSNLGLNITTEPGTTYFLCNSIDEVPALVGSQDAASLTSLSGQQKVQILVCKQVSYDANIEGQAEKETHKTTSSSGESFLPKSVQMIKEETKVGVMKSSVKVTSTFEKQCDHHEESKLAPKIKIEAPSTNLQLKQLSSKLSYKSDSPVGSQVITTSVPTTFKSEEVQIRSSTSNPEKESSLPCLSLRQELKQAILQRRMVQGKTMIDLVKEENERKAVLQSMKMSEEEVEKMLKRRVSNNRAARKCREKRKMEEEQLMQEAKRLKERKNELNEVIATLEKQQKYLRLYVTGAKEVDTDSKEMLSTILYSEVKIPDLPPRTMVKWDSDMSNSVILSSSEYNSDDTRNGFELDSSQETNDTRDSASVNDVEMEKRDSAQNISEKSSDTKCIETENEKRNFKEIDDRSAQGHSDDDSDVELIDFDRPLVIDVS